MKHYITLNKKYHNEITASERSVMDYSGGAHVFVCMYVCWGGGEGGGGEGKEVGGELKLALQDPDYRSHLP